MKKLFFSAFVLLASVLVYGQARDSLVESQKRQQPAAVIEFPYTPDIVNAALDDYLSKKGKSRSTDLRGFTTYRNTQVTQNDSMNADMYFKVERKSRQEKGNTIVSLLITSPEGTSSAGNLLYMDMEQSKQYLNQLLPAVEAYNLEQVIKDHNAALIKAESRVKDLEKDGAELEEKRQSIEKKIRDNKTDQQQQVNEVEKLKQKLAEWVGQRKS